jgi:hypothetical protein
VTFNDSTRRAIRTGIDSIVGILAIALVVIPTLGAFGVNADNVAAWTAIVVAATATASKVRNQLEDQGWIPVIAGSKDAPGRHSAEHFEAQPELPLS